MNERVVRWSSWSLVGLYVLLSAVGIYLQSLSHTYVLGLSFPLVIFSFLSYGVYLAIGVLIASRQPKNPIGWLMCLVPIVSTVDFITFGYAYYGLVAHPGSLPGADVPSLWLTFGGRPFGILSITLVLLWFPDGRTLSPRWRIVGWVAAVAFALYLLLAALKPGPIEFFPLIDNPLAVSERVWAVLGSLNEIVGIIVILSLPAALVSLLLRLRRARRDERQQIKWIVYSLAATVIFFLFISTWGSGIPRSAILPLLYVFLMGIGFAIAVSIFKYRLYDIDLIINRTLVYGALTAALALVYFMSVALLQQVFPARSPIAIVLSTLAIAALFAPLRRRIQYTIDKRFYRQKYDAEKTLAAFNAITRDEVEIERLTDTLLGVVEETIQPEHVSLWLKPVERKTIDR